MLTRKQHELITFIQNRLEESGISPSFEEMKDALDLKSKSGVHRLISALEERGFIRRLPNRARALEVIKTPEGSVARTAPRAANANDALAPLRATAPRSAPANDVIAARCNAVSRFALRASRFSLLLRMTPSATSSLPSSIASNNRSSGDPAGACAQATEATSVSMAARSQRRTSSARIERGC